MPSRFLRFNLLVTDIGFLLYWFMSAFGLLPEASLYKDSANPILVAWNWSFAPVDLAASVTGIVALVVSSTLSGCTEARGVAAIRAAIGDAHFLRRIDGNFVLVFTPRFRHGMVVTEYLFDDMAACCFWRIVCVRATG